MNDLAVALALVLVVEGLAYALFPRQMQRMMEKMKDLSLEQLRVAGLAAAAIGTGLAWFLRR
jgi:uncharacterized protein YjeT (DUF2065 family)